MPEAKVLVARPVGCVIRRQARAGPAAPLAQHVPVVLGWVPDGEARLVLRVGAPPRTRSIVKRHSDSVPPPRETCRPCPHSVTSPGNMS